MGNTLTAVVDRIIDLVYRRDFEYAELQGGWVALFWGLWLVVAKARAFTDEPADQATIAKGVSVTLDAEVAAAVKTLITDFKSELQAIGVKAG